MGRRVATSESEPGREQLLEDRYRWLGRRFLVVVGLGSDGAAVCERVLAKRDRIDRSGQPIGERLATLENYLASERLLDIASRFADRYGYSVRPK